MGTLPQLIFGRKRNLPLYGVDTLWATHESVPILESDGRTIVVGHDGLHWVESDGTLQRFEIPEELDECDEIHTSSGALIGTTLGIKDVRVVIHQLRSRRTDELVLRLDSWNADLGYCVVSAGTLACVDPGEGSARIRAYDVDTWQSVFATEIPFGLDREVVAVSSSHVVVREDHGVQGDHVLVYSVAADAVVLESASDVAGSQVWQTRSGLTFVAVRRVTEADGIAIVDADGHVDYLPIAGVLGSIGGDIDTCLFSVFGGHLEHVYRVDLNDSGPSFSTALSSCTGKKYVGRGVQRWISRGIAEGIVLESRDDRRHIQPDRLVPGRFHLRARSAETGTTALDLIESTSDSLVIHFHGGPESYETEEQRLFGLPLIAAERGWNWISLNYSGSRSADGSSTVRAWRNWRRSLVEDLNWARGDRKPTALVLAGWSFGAAAALALSREVQVDGLIIGGAMGSLESHVRDAAQIDPAHQSWFERRFDLDGDDACFFSGIAPAESSLPRVLSFHGALDPHCPYENFDRVRSAWLERGASWEHHALPAGAHYVSTLEEATLVSAASTRFLESIAAAS